MFKKNKPYGEVCGLGIAYKYEQDNKFYDQHFNEVTEQGEPVAGGEFITAENERQFSDNKKVKEFVAEATGGEYDNALAVDQSESRPVPETEIPLAEGVDLNIGDIDELTMPEIKEQLDRLGIDYPSSMRKPDLIALLRDELVTQVIEETERLEENLEDEQEQS